MPKEPTKKCTLCKTEKPLAAFRKDGRTPKGTVRHRSQCRACFSANKRQFRHKDEHGRVIRLTHCEACGAELLDGQWFTCNDKCRMRLADQKKAREEREYREWEKRLIELRDKPRKLLEARKNEGSKRVPPGRVSRRGAMPLLREPLPRS